MRIATITLNTAFDLVGRLQKITLGEVNSVETLGLFPAGKGINVAKVLHDLGGDVTVSGFLGEDNQAEFIQLFQQLNLTDKFQRVAGKTRINVKITETQADVTDLNFSGYEIKPQDWQKFVEESLAWGKDYDLIAVCGSLPKGLATTDFTHWLQRLTQQSKLVLDSSHQAFTAGLQAKPWLVKPNQHELASWIGHDLNSLDDVISAAKQLQNTGVENVIISMGEKGAIWVTQVEVIYAQPPKCENVVSTVGAGDSMVAGLIHGFSQSLTKPDILRFASAVSALAVSQSNVGVSDFVQLQQLLENVKINLI